MPPLRGFHGHSSHSLSKKPATKGSKSEHGSHNKENGGVQKPKGPREPRPALGDRTNREETFKKQEDQTAARQADEQLEQKAKVSAEFIKKQEEALKYWNTRTVRPPSPSSNKALTPEQRRREFQSETERRRQAAREGLPSRSSTPEPNPPAPPYHADVSPPPYKAVEPGTLPPAYSKKPDAYDNYEFESNQLNALRKHQRQKTEPETNKRKRDEYENHELESQKLNELRQSKRQKTEPETNFQTKEDAELKEALAKSQKEADELKAKEQADLDKALAESKLDAEKQAAKEKADLDKALADSKWEVADLKILEQDQANLDRALAASKLHHDNSDYGKALAASSGHTTPSSFFSQPEYEKSYTSTEIQAARDSGSIKEGKKKAVDDPALQPLPVDPIVEAQKKELADYRFSLAGPSRMDWYS